MPGSDQADKDARSTKCPQCGYSLIALPEIGRCPECGVPYDPVTLAYVPDAKLERRNRQAWAAVMLPLVLMGTMGFIYCASLTTVWMVVGTLVSASAAVPMARSVLVMAPFHPPSRLMGASIAGLICLILGFFVVVYGLGPAGLRATLEWRVVGGLACFAASPLVALAYAKLGARVERQSRALGGDPRSSKPNPDETPAP